MVALAMLLPSHAAAARSGAPVAVAATKTLRFTGTRIGPRRYAFVVRRVRPAQVRGGIARLGRSPERRLSAGWLRRALRRGPVVRVRFHRANRQTVRSKRRAVLLLEVDAQRPGPPLGLIATPGDGMVALRWSAASDDVRVAGYRVYAGPRQVAALGGRARSYEARGLLNGQAQLFAVRAVDEAGQLSPAAWAWGTPGAAPPVQPPAPPPDLEPPTVPAALTATPGDRAVALEWQASHDDVAVRGYRIYRGGRQIAATGATHWDDRRLVNGTTYSYKVRAVDMAGNVSGASLPATATPHVAVGAGLPARLPESRGTTFYVSPSGDDDGDGSAGAPWRTIQKAADTLTAGQTALVRAGTYDQDVMITRAGAADDPITIKAYPGEHPILGPATGNTDDIPMTITNGSGYLRLQGLTFAGATGPGTTNIWVAGDAHDIEISDCEVRDSQRQGFFSDATTQRVQIIGCYFHDNGGSGPPQLDHNLYIEGTGHAVINNLIARSPNGHGIQIYPVSDHVLVAGNTITGAYFAGILLGGGASTTSRDATIVNNIVTDNRIGIYTFWEGASGANDVIRGNLLHGNTEADFAGSGAELIDNLSADPLFADPADDDFHLRAGSPALDVAVPQYTAPVDLDHAPRPQGSGPDLGAYER